MIPPGATIGILGGGQLGRMTGIAARQLGYRLVVLDPMKNSPAGQIADRQIVADHADPDALDQLANATDVITYEFENIPVQSVEKVAQRRLTHPKPEVLHLCQNREREKTFLRDAGFPCAPFALVDSPAALEQATATIGLPAVLKTADFGYDGKGQRKIGPPPHDWKLLWREFGASRGVLEEFISFASELSVIVARSEDGDLSVFPVAENVHTKHILDFTIVPARVTERVQQAATDLACSIAEALDVVGLLAVELFLTDDSELLVNELAPRPHNSGHWTLDGALTSQFEQHVRAVCGLPLGDPRQHRPTVMVNLLGDLWAKGEPPWHRVLGDTGAKLHLYGKAEARPGRKMGHVNLVADTVDDAFRRAQAIKSLLMEHAERGCS